MELARCKKGHFYDKEKYKCCPHCEKFCSEDFYVPEHILQNSIPEKFQTYGNAKILYQKNDCAIYSVGEEYVLKVQYGNRMEAGIKEGNILLQLGKNSHTVELVDYCIEENIVYLLERRYSTLSEYIRSKSIYWSDVWQIAYDICDALIYCKNHGFYHLDVHPKNIYMNGDRAILGDFGNAQGIFGANKNSLKEVTPGYVPPFYYHQENIYIHDSWDLYGLCLVVYGLLNEGRWSFAELSAINAEYMLLNREGVPESGEDELSKLVVNVMSKILAKKSYTQECFLEELLRCKHNGSKTDLEIRKIYPTTASRSEKPKRSTIFSRLFKDKKIRQPKEEKISAEEYCSFDDDFFADEQTPKTSKSEQVFACASIAPMTAKEQEKPILSEVYFSVVSEKNSERDSTIMIDVVMYENAFREEVDRLLSELEQGQEKKSGLLKTALGTLVLVELTSQDIEIEDNQCEMTWEGNFLDFSFFADVPKDFEKRQIRFTASVFFDGIPATRLKFVVKCINGGKEKPEFLREDIRSAFISYASQDRARVARLIQGMKSVRPDLELFFDVSNLRTGELWEKALYQEIAKRDYLFLCWSSNALRSPWVDREWRYALRLKGESCILPIPLEPPELCPPPSELAHKHFNNQLLYLIF